MIKQAVESPTVSKRRTKMLVGITALLLLVALIAYVIVRFTSESPVVYDNIEEHFKHGSIGSEPANGLPYWIWKALPVMFPEKLPDKSLVSYDPKQSELLYRKGYESLGFLFEEGRDLPIGLSQRQARGIDLVWLNCAVCHTGTMRESLTAKHQLLPGAPSNNMRLYDFIQFLRAAALDNRFNPDFVMEKIQQVGGNLSFIDRLIYRYFVVGRVRTALLKLRSQLAYMDRQYDWGPGRVDTFNPYKVLQFNFPMDNLPLEELNGSAEYPSIWNQRPRQGMNLHWDGDNSLVQERNLSAALGAGVTPVTVDRAAIGRIEEWLWNLPAPRYPKLAEVDQAKAAAGQELYGHYCANCHGKKEGDKYDFDTHKFTQLGQVEPLEDIGTDPGRLTSYTLELVGNQNLLFAGYPWRFKHFRKTNGYANQPLDGIWARSPYLHNGSVPTLRDLLNPAEQRPKVFYRGYDVYDWKKVGYIADVAEENGKPFFRFDTQVPGNSNAGHDGEEYGTHLSDEQKDAIVEYMKTF
jgi:hypothetical protein